MRRIIETSVGELMSAPALAVRPETTIVELTRLFVQHEYNGLPVVGDDMVLQGMVTQLDLFKLHLQPHPQHLPALQEPWISSVGDIMTLAPITLYPVEPAIKAMAVMVDYRIRTIPVVADVAGAKRVIGVITRRDLLAALNP